MAKALTKKEGNRERVREHRQRERDRAELMRVFSAACPEGIGEHIRISLELEDGEPHLAWYLDDEGAKFINDFAATIEMPGDQKFPADLVLRELSVYMGKKLMGREYDWQSEYDWQKGDADDGQTTQAS